MALSDWSKAEALLREKQTIFVKHKVEMRLTGDSLILGDFLLPIAPLIFPRSHRCIKLCGINVGV